MSKKITKKTSKKVWIDSDDAPELTKEWFASADLYRGDKLVRRGRPPKENPKVLQTIRIDADVLEAFKETGHGWQTKMNEVLRKAVPKL